MSRHLLPILKASTERFPAYRGGDNRDKEFADRDALPNV